MPTRRISGTATSSSVPDNGGDHSGGGGAGGYVENVFSTYVYEGNSQERDIVNGIDLADEGGLVWTKARTMDWSHGLVDTERGASTGIAPGKTLKADRPDPPGIQMDVTSFNTSGYTIGSDHFVNKAGEDYTSWTFRKAPYFFDVVTYTGDGTVGQVVPHNLGVVPGMVIVKSVSSTANWGVHHKDYSFAGGQGDGMLNSSASFTYGFVTATSDTNFTLNASAETNNLNEEYVAYLFAHDDSDESIIKCGSYTGNRVDGVEIDLGWEPQWILIKSASSAELWLLLDTMRGLVTDDSQYLIANAADAESAAGTPVAVPTATGFKLPGGTGWNANNKTGEEYLYMAIRRPNKPASEFEPEELFDVKNRNQTTFVYDAAFPVDMCLYRYILTTELGARLLQTTSLDTAQKWGQQPKSHMMFDSNAGWGENVADEYSWMWRRAPGFLDVVCHMGDGQEGREIPHNLGVFPEMAWTKSFAIGGYLWSVYHKDTNPADTSQNWRLELNSDFARQPSINGSTNYYPFATSPDLFPVGNANAVNRPGIPYITFLFA